MIAKIVFAKPLIECAFGDAQLSQHSIDMCIHLMWYHKDVNKSQFIELTIRVKDMKEQILHTHKAMSFTGVRSHGIPLRIRYSSFTDSLPITVCLMDRSKPLQMIIIS